jgi:hypothetical protein
MNMSQCLFVTRDAAKSASLAVATPASADSGARSLRAFWRSQFHSPPKQEEERRPASRKSPAESAFSSSREARETGPYRKARRKRMLANRALFPLSAKRPLGRQSHFRRPLHPSGQPLSPHQRGRHPQRIHAHRQMQVPIQRHPPPPPSPPSLTIRSLLPGLTSWRSPPILLGSRTRLVPRRIHLAMTIIPTNSGCSEEKALIPWAPTATACLTTCGGICRIHDS